MLVKDALGREVDLNIGDTVIFGSFSDMREARVVGIRVEQRELYSSYVNIQKLTVTYKRNYGPLNTSVRSTIENWIKKA